MPYARPTLTEIFGSALQDIQAAKLPGVDGLLQKAVLRVLARAESGLAYEHYGYQDWIARQAVPWTATDEFLDGWAALKGVTRKPATYAALTVAFSGTAGTDLPSGTAMATPASVGFSSTADGIVPVSGGVVVPVVAEVAGTTGNLAVGATITLASVITGINSTGAVTAVATTAADQETDDELRTRMLQVYANPPQGGAQSDYVTWAEAVTGVTRAWCNPNGAGPGTVVVYAMLDGAEGGHGGFPQGSNGVAAADPRDTPATGDQLTIANAIYPLQPVTALVYVCAPSAFSVAFTIVDVFPFTAAIQAGIAAALSEMFLRLGSPLGMTLYPSDWNEAIASVSGIEHFAVTNPTAPVAVPLGSLPLYSGTSTTSA